MIKDLDFSKISTEELVTIINNYSAKYNNSACGGIGCNKTCPFYIYEAFRCCTTNRPERHELFKKELERRIKLENKMPELKAGMVVEVDHGIAGKNKYLVITKDWGISIEEKGYTSFSNNEDNPITDIYSVTDICSLKHISKYLKLIWSKNSPNQQKIEEIKKTIEELKNNHNESIRELEEQVKGLEESDK